MHARGEGARDVGGVVSLGEGGPARAGVGVTGRHQERVLGDFVGGVGGGFGGGCCLVCW